MPHVSSARILHRDVTIALIGTRLLEATENPALLNKTKDYFRTTQTSGLMDREAAKPNL